MLENLLINSPPVIHGSIGDPGPGPQTLIGGDETAGFYGKMPSAGFINGNLLASEIGLTAGSSANPNVDWLKFASNGKVLYYPIRTFRTSVSWNDIYAVGAVYGDDTNGRYPPAGIPTRKQDATVVINGYLFRVRLISIGPDGVDYSSSITTSSNDSPKPIPETSEWGRLMPNVCSVVTPGMWGKKWASYTPAELGISSGAVCPINSYGANTFYVGAYASNVKYPLLWILQSGKTTKYSNGMWRPILELVGKVE